MILVFYSLLKDEYNECSIVIRLSIGDPKLSKRQVSSYLDVIDTDQVDKQYIVQLLGK